MEEIDIRTFAYILEGDCTPERHPQWYVADDFYIKLIKLIDNLLQGQIKIYICTQGKMKMENELEHLIESDRFKIQTTSNLWSNDAEQMISKVWLWLIYFLQRDRHSQMGRTNWTKKISN